MTLPTLSDRASGVLLHPTSLPGPFGCGDLGLEARRFARFLADGAQRFWQMLPVGPIGYGNSPYSAQSSFAGNPLLVSLEDLAHDGLLDRDELARTPELPEGRVDYARTIAYREKMLRAAFVCFEERRDPTRARALEAFAEQSRAWLDDFTLFRAIKRAHGEVSWVDWPPPLRDRDPAALAKARAGLDGEIAYERFVQFVFAEQWRRLRRECASLGVALIGDVPIFLAHDSAEVWAHRELFFLDARGMPTIVAGVPPDYFSATGQRWGNPLYRWKVLAKDGYGWWIERLRATLARFDVVRLDHFIGFTRYWAIPSTCPTAIDGKWVRGPGADFFEAARRALGKEQLPLIAEDLGAITPRVKAVRDRFRLPGIRLLQFAFGTDPSAPDFVPHNYPRRAVVYTGTHDNDTTMGWFHDKGGGDSTRTPEQCAIERETVLRYLGPGAHSEGIHWAMIRCVMASVARLAIFPMQDLLGLGSEARMNRPGKGEGNWEWRAREVDFDQGLAERLAALTRTYGRGA